MSSNVKQVNLSELARPWVHFTLRFDQGMHKILSWDRKQEYVLLDAEIRGDSKLFLGGPNSDELLESPTAIISFFGAFCDKREFSSAAIPLQRKLVQSVILDATSLSFLRPKLASSMRTQRIQKVISLQGTEPSINTQNLDLYPGGLCVRSEMEQLLSILLDNLKLDYEYERPFKTRYGGHIYPDFTIFDDNITFIVEHAGYNHQEYKDSLNRKIECYDQVNEVVSVISNWAELRN